MTVDHEREELITVLASQRELFRITLRGIEDDQARQRSTVSELTLGGLLHHIINTERHWTTILVERDPNSEFDVSGMDSEYRMDPDETVAGLLAEWEAVAEQTAKVIRELPNLEDSVPTPTAPWAPERQWLTVRYIVLHILREISQHSGHADIIREALDGANTTYQRAV
ncbi:DinB family protein [Nocardia sp. NBC_01503]|uniref:DinB family protein n=1 Tax=Nocardia sp. NBC_01503 TaxID=2975997 RepID=UPI002E7B6A70|nr:DinB family protein [Nocardia sp. NBC_01503]WTL34428.1 DinB family protein [Nocardia sp. NBC_01503]